MKAAIQSLISWPHWHNGWLACHNLFKRIFFFKQLLCPLLSNWIQHKGPFCVLSSSADLNKQLFEISNDSAGKDSDMTRCSISGWCMTAFVSETCRYANCYFVEVHNSLIKII